VAGDPTMQFYLCMIRTTLDEAKAALAKRYEEVKRR